MTGALLTDVPTPKPSAPASERVLTDSSSSPPETKILTSLNPLESSSQRTSLIISWKLPLRELGVSNLTHTACPSGCVTRTDCSWRRFRDYPTFSSSWEEPAEPLCSWTIEGQGLRETMRDSRNSSLPRDQS